MLNFFTTDPGVEEGVDRYMDEWVNDYQRWKAMYGDQYREATGMVRCRLVVAPCMKPNNVYALASL